MWSTGRILRESAGLIQSAPAASEHAEVMYSVCWSKKNDAGFFANASTIELEYRSLICLKDGSDVPAGHDSWYRMRNGAFYEQRRFLRISVKSGGEETTIFVESVIDLGTYKVVREEGRSKTGNIETRLSDVTLARGLRVLHGAREKIRTLRAA